MQQRKNFKSLPIELIKDLIRLINRLLNKIGLDIKGYPNSDAKRRMMLMRHYKIDTLLDIGANCGQYSKNLREMGYKGKIVSFEPLNNAFKKLERTSSKDKSWIINNYAIGNKNTKSIINVAGNSYSSSILKMLPKHLNSAPTSKYIAKQEIEVKTLDSIYKSFCTTKSHVMVKIDTQGYEKNVLDGADKSLKNIKIIQLEMSLVQLYEKEMLFNKMIDHLEKKGFQLFSLENGFAHPKTGQLLQVDGIFVSVK